MNPAVESPKATKVTVLYNGRTAELHYRAEEKVRVLLDRALHHFEIPVNPEEMSLFTTAGSELPTDETLTRAGVTPGEELILRQRVVRGGRQ